MTFSRPAIERLIATVESGLQYGELGAYSQGLRDALAEIDRLTAERNNARWADETRKKACEALITERDAMRPVVEAAEKWLNGRAIDIVDNLRRIRDAIDAYRAAKERP